MAYPLEFIAAGGTVSFNWYTENGGVSVKAIQPQDATAAGIPYGYAVKAREELLDCALSAMSKAEADALQSFFDATVDGMQQTFTYRDNLSVIDLTVRFADPELTITPVAHNVYSTRFKLRVI